MENNIIEKLRSKFIDKGLGTEYDITKFLSINAKMLNSIPEEHWDWCDGYLCLQYNDFIYFDFNKEEIEIIKNLKAGNIYKGYKILTDDEMNDNIYPLDWMYATNCLYRSDYVELNVDNKYNVYVDLRDGNRYQLTGIDSLLLSREPGLISYHDDSCSMYYDGNNPFAIYDSEKDMTFIGDGNGYSYIMISGCIYPFDMGNCLDGINSQAHIDYESIEYPDTSDDRYKDIWEEIPDKYYNNDVIIEGGDCSSILIDVFGDEDSYIPLVPVIKCGERLNVSEIIFRYRYLEKKFNIPFRGLWGFYNHRW